MKNKLKPLIRLEHGVWRVSNFNYCMQNTMMNSLERNWLRLALNWTQAKNREILK